LVVLKIFNFINLRTIVILNQGKLKKCDIRELKFIRECADNMKTDTWW